jgi:hypothetical protein
MNVLLRRGDVVTRPAGALALGILEGASALTGAAAAVDRATRGAIRSLLRSGDFTGRFLETAVLYPRGVRAQRVILIGLGRARDLDAGRVRRAAALAARRARALGAGTLATVAHGAGRGGLDPARAARRPPRARFSVTTASPHTSAMPARRRCGRSKCWSATPRSRVRWRRRSSAAPGGPRRRAWRAT